MTRTVAETLYLVHHIFLPPKLPQQDDSELSNAKALLLATLGSLLKFRDHVADVHRPAVTSAYMTMQFVDDIHMVFGDHLAVNEDQLKLACEKICVNGGVLSIQVEAQNAGVMISKEGQNVVLESFELSPRNEAAMSTRGRLRRTFPGTAASIKLSTFEDSAFQSVMASTLAKLSLQPVPDAQPKAKKAGQMHEEHRDTTNPKMVTEFLTTVLLAQDGASSAAAHAICKNTREDIVYRSGLLPWRRSPLWLLLRVTLHLMLQRYGREIAYSGNLYKEFMLFLMAHVLRDSHACELESDYLLAMNAKLNRRLLKLKCVPATLRRYVHGVMNDTNTLLQTRWGSIQEAEKMKSVLPLAKLRDLDFHEDSKMSLPKLETFIGGISDREANAVENSFVPTPTTVHFQCEVLPSALSGTSNARMDATLAAMESWVEVDLDGWLAAHQHDPDTCGKLKSLMQEYHSTASRVYSSNPEAGSVMVLTLLELWVACDKSATEICELLHSYKPGLSCGPLESLILPHRSQLERLARVERHILLRCGRSTLASDLVFASSGASDAFGIRFFEQSKLHQNLSEDIERKATKDRLKKRAEFARLKQQWNSLREQAAQLCCDYVTREDPFLETITTEHSPRCAKCQLESRANSLCIGVHEWPLPTDVRTARCTVFELHVPASFGNWRDATAFVMMDVLKMKYSVKQQPQGRYALRTYEGLSEFFQPFQGSQRVELLSETKPHTSTHRRNRRICTSSEEDVCLNNGLQLQYFDNADACYTCTTVETHQLPIMCTYSIPTNTSAKSPLQPFVFRPFDDPSGSPPNAIMAALHLCPDNMSLEEYKALCAIPYGYRTQWQNILVQLNAPAVDFKKVETELVILQCAGQVGPPHGTDVLRASHRILDDDAFADALLDGISQASRRLDQTWQATSAFRVFVSLAVHLLSLSTSRRIKQGCVHFLEQARAITMSWMKTLLEKANASTKSTTRDNFRARAVHAALVCGSTFDAEGADLKQCLASSEEASCFLQCAINIQENGSLIRVNEYSLSLLYARWKRLCQKAWPKHVEQLLGRRSSEALDDAIATCWHAYDGNGTWQQVPGTGYGSWVVKDTYVEADNRWVQVQFDLATGQLLINGSPLNRLPREYEQHPTYRRLFGRCTMDVLPSALPGMQFYSRIKYADHVLHFGLSEGVGPGTGSTEPDLRIRAQKDDVDLELVPQNILRNNFPVPLVRDYVHWYDVSTKVVEFRPQSDPWTRSHENWTLRRGGAADVWHLEAAGQKLIGVHSRTGKALDRIFRPIEERCWVQAALNQSSNVLHIELPRLKLGFQLNGGKSKLVSKQFREMCLDEDQTIGTLFGLRNKIVLADRTFRTKRMILVPAGQITFSKDAGHTAVQIEHGTASKTHAYTVDKQLGRLIDNGTAQSKLIMAYLHALTSFCLPDPLTGHTGTEQALSILDSAALKSFDVWSKENIDTLAYLAALTPGRQYYPRHKRTMQTVHWSSDLGFMAQHGRFHTLVRRHFDRAARSKFLYEDSWIEPPRLDKVDEALLERDDRRSSTFRISGFGAESQPQPHDALYEGRDRWQETRRVRDVFAIAQTMSQSSTTLPFSLPIGLHSHLWHLLSGPKCIHGSDHNLTSLTLAYDSMWLEKSTKLLQYWPSLHRRSSQGMTGTQKFNLAFMLSTIAFSGHVDMAVVYIVAAFALLPELGEIDPPVSASFFLKRGTCIDANQVFEAVLSASKDLGNTPDVSLQRLRGESKANYRSRRQNQFNAHRQAAAKSLAKALKKQWPCQTLVEPVESDTSGGGWYAYINMSQAMASAGAKFRSWFDNRQFEAYLTRISNVLPAQVVVTTMPSPLPLPAAITSNSNQGYVTADDLLSQLAATMPDTEPPHPRRRLTWQRSTTKTEFRLQNLVRLLKDKAGSAFERTYVDQLQLSLEALRGRQCSESPPRCDDDINAALREYQAGCKRHAEGIYQLLVEQVHSMFYDQSSGANDASSRGEQLPARWQLPRICPGFFLQQLCRTRWVRLSSGWQRCIVQYGLALTQLQQAERFLSLSTNSTKLMEEMRNVGHMNWDPHENPESLLLEVESNITIRYVQTRIAAEMREPSTGRNATMQLNMGEGKSSVIVPTVVAYLADGKTIVCLVVGKAQAKQMFDMLVSKLGGLLGRPVFHLPFSRAVKLGETEAAALRAICLDCMKQGGVLLVQPEHLLSLKLMSVERAISKQDRVSVLLLELQDLLAQSCRRVLDESDDQFSHKRELVYPVGSQRPIDHSPARWGCIQQVLEVCRSCVPRICETYPSSVEVQPQTRGGFARTRILQDDARDELLAAVAGHISQVGLVGLPVEGTDRQALYRYLTATDVDVSALDAVERFWETEAAKNTLVLLRGLFAGGVLAFVFTQKRWRVDYGLALDRVPSTKLAVPYQAKDSPSLRSEFSHPDVVILLTQLSYYYGGLQDGELHLAFSHLLRSDQAISEYQEWVTDADGLPSSFSQLDGVNLEDDELCVQQIYPHLRHAKSVVDYYLAHLVFPKEMREFPHKLSASGWDLADSEDQLMTGFSGTNDSRIMLPLSVDQLDLDDQRHTNALVLEYLLQPENSVASIPATRREEMSDAERLLSMVTSMDRPVRVILDVGAQILELTNRELAARWLAMVPEDARTQAVVFFDDSDSLCVLDRDGQVEPLRVSPFAARLDVCLIFLDEAHTRGTDLKLPIEYRAAVTLGAKLTKDRLVQACMRMRQLGKGQSVVFCVSEEINTKIRAFTSKEACSALAVQDVLAWAVSETWLDAQRGMALWAVQGRRYIWQQGLWTNARTDDVTQLSEDLADQFLEDEGKSVWGRYRRAKAESRSTTAVDAATGDLAELERRCREFDADREIVADLEEQQERELSPEAERQEQPERPQPAEPTRHQVHRHVRELIEDGSVQRDTDAYMPAFDALFNTSAAVQLDLDANGEQLYVTADFANTVRTRHQSDLMDFYQRPVQWILYAPSASSSAGKTVSFMLIISPFEAHDLLFEIADSCYVSLHLYAARPNLGFKPLDSLDLFTTPPRSRAEIPRGLTITLNLFAGQLYFDSYREYEETYHFIRAASGKDSEIALTSQMSSESMQGHTRFIDSLTILMTRIRRRCESISKTDVGKLLCGAILTPDRWERWSR